MSDSDPSRQDGAPSAQAIRNALTALVIALDPEPDEGSTCWVCRCEDSEYDEPHVRDCAYAAARRLVGRGPVEDGGSALVGDPGERGGL